VILTKQLVVSVIELIKFYSEKGVFKINEYKDIAAIDDRLKSALKGLEDGSPYEEFSAQEYGFIVLIFKEGSTRIPTSIDSFGQIYSIYQSFQALLEQKAQEEQEPKSVAQPLPTVEELSE
jgi:hypothetical protein